MFIEDSDRAIFSRGHYSQRQHSRILRYLFGDYRYNCELELCRIFESEQTLQSRKLCDWDEHSRERRLTDLVIHAHGWGRALLEQINSGIVVVDEQETCLLEDPIYHELLEGL